MDSQDSHGFYVFDAHTLTRKTRKPRHLEARFNSNNTHITTSSKFESLSESDDPLTPTTQRRTAFLDARRNKLARRISHVRDVYTAHLCQLSGEITARKKKLSETIQIAEKNRATIIEKQVQRQKSALNHVKKVAELQAIRRADETEALRKAIDERLSISAVRRQRLMRIPRSRRLETHADSTEELLNMHLTAASVIQNWYRQRKLRRSVTSFESHKLTVEICATLSFDDLVKLLQSETLISSVSALFGRLRMMTVKGDNAISPQWSSPARIYLTAYLVGTHPKEIMTQVGESEENLSKTAISMIQSFEAWTDGFATERAFELAATFSALWVGYYEAFQKWKVEDTRKMIDGMISHWIELERLWLSVKDQIDAETEWKPKLESQQRQIYSRIRKFGKSALMKLHQEQEKVKQEFLSAQIQVEDEFAYEDSDTEIYSAPHTPMSESSSPRISTPDAENRSRPRNKLQEVLSTSPQRFPSGLSTPKRADSVTSTRSASSSSSIRSRKMSDVSPGPNRSSPKKNNPVPNIHEEPKLPPTPSESAPELKRMLAGFSDQLTNEQLAHEVVMDPDFQLKPARRSPLEEQVRTLTKRAFFDGVRREFAAGKMDYFPILVSDIKQQLLGMVSDTGKIAQEVNEQLDVDFIQEQIQHTKTFDIRNCLHYITSKMASLCAPIRDASIRQLNQLTDIVSVLEKMLEILDDMKLDLANYKLQTLRPYLKQEAVEYETKKFAEAVKKGTTTLTKTHKWLSETSKNLVDIANARNPEKINTPENKIRFEDVYHDALLSLIFSNTPVNDENVPETLQMDAQRLFQWQNEGQALTIVAALLMLSKNIVPALRKDPKSAPLIKLKETLYVLLKDSETTIENLNTHIISTMNSVLSKNDMIPISSTTAVGSNSGTQLTPEQEQLVKTMVEKTLSYKDPIYSLLSRRIQTTIKNNLNTGVFKRESLASHGLELLQVELEDLSRRIILLAKHNKQVYAKYYDEILKKTLD